MFPMCIADCFCVLQCGAVCFCVLLCVAACCSVWKEGQEGVLPQRPYIHPSHVLQYVAVSCSELQ